VSVGSEFDPTRLTLARRLAGLTKRDLAERLQISAPAITQFEAGQTTPRRPLLAQLGLVLGYPVAYFLRPEGRRAGRVDTRSFFRSLRTTRQWERDRAEALAEHVADLIALIGEEIELPELRLPECAWITSAAVRDDVEQAAELVRREWELPPGPVGHVVRELEAHGIFVCRFGDQESRVDAFSRWLDDVPLVVLWASKNDKARSRFDASHELGHLVMHPDPEAANPVLERQAHAFAAAFLLPAEQIEQELPRRPPRPADWDDLFATRRHWGVSIAALFRRAHDLGTLSEASFRRSMMQLSKRGMRRDEGDDLGPPERPRLLVQAVDAFADAQRVELDGIADRLHFSGAHVRELVGPAPDAGPVDPAPNTSALRSVPAHTVRQEQC
jgi:Zn-dependent peptidase ImmA (M78 family)/DNA-binding XRE family transcriptional regulator